MVGQLWGTVQKQKAPDVFYQFKREKEIKTFKGNETALEKVPETYQVSYSAKYHIVNEHNENMDILFSYRFPTAEGVYDNFNFHIDGEKIKEIAPELGNIFKKIKFKPFEEKYIEISYESQGMDGWWYVFGENASQIGNFKFATFTNFDKINFLENSTSSTQKEKKDNGWKLTWQYSNLISGIQIGMEIPENLNPGPFVSRISFFAPFSLFFFFF